MESGKAGNGRFTTEDTESTESELFRLSVHSVVPSFRLGYSRHLLRGMDADPERKDGENLGLMNSGTDRLWPGAANLPERKWNVEIREAGTASEGRANRPR